MTVPAWFWMITAFAFGITIGSFLNVVIYRLPIANANLDLAKPTWSLCPNCKNRLTARDLVPLFSFLLLGRKCRHCKTPISWRYFCVELLTGLLFVALYLRFPESAPNAVALMLFTAVLIPITFIDLETFTIPDSLNLALFGVAIGRDVWGILQHEHGHELLWGWMPRSVLGAVVGTLIFGAVRVLGWMGYKKEAMGIGDVYLARGIGAMLISVTPPDANPLRLFPVWTILSVVTGLALGGGALLVSRLRADRQPVTKSSDFETESGRMEESSTLVAELKTVGEVFILSDLIYYLRLKWQTRGADPEMEEVPDDWTPASTAIPFGPFLSIGFLLTVFFGEWITAAYLAFALPKTI